MRTKDEIDLEWINLNRQEAIAYVAIFNARRKYKRDSFLNRESTPDDIKMVLPYILEQLPRQSIKELGQIVGEPSYAKMRKICFDLERQGYIGRLPEKVQLTQIGNCRSWQWEVVKLPTLWFRNKNRPWHSPLHPLTYFHNERAIHHPIDAKSTDLLLVLWRCLLHVASFLRLS